MKLFKASMVLAVAACCLGTYWLFGSGSPAKAWAGLYMLGGGFAWAVVVRLVSSFATPRVIIEKDGRHAR
jgi:hypothetical protein